MADGETSGAVSEQAAEGALAYLTEMSADLRGAAIVGSDGSVLAASGDAGRWDEDVAYGNSKLVIEGMLRDLAAGEAA